MIIVISNPTVIANEQESINQLFDEGLEIFHVRKKGYSENEMRIFIEQIPEKYFNRVVLHSHYQLANEYNLKGIHVPLDFKTEDSKLTKSFSFHSIGEIEKYDKKFAYGFLSPVFDSISKQGYKSKLDLKEIDVFLQTYKSLSPMGRAGDGLLLLALGGIDEDKIDIIKELGFSGIALLGAIWQSKNPIEKFKRIKEKWLKTELMY